MKKYYAIEYDLEYTSDVCNFQPSEKKAIKDEGNLEWIQDQVTDNYLEEETIYLYEVTPIKKLVRRVTERWVDIDEDD